VKNYCKLIRIHQWIKNGFVFLPVFFAGELLNTQFFVKSLMGFFIFSFIASSIYVINDYVDIESDRQHPEKKNRPLASGAVSKNEAVIIGLFLIVVAYLMCWLWGNWKIAVIISTYFVMNLAYSFKLKHIAIIDVMIIAIGFLLRVFIGGYMTGLIISIWGILLTFFLALIMGIGKRRGELLNAELTGKTRKALDGYNLQFTDMAMTVVSSCVIVCYTMYTLDSQTQKNLHPNIVYTVIFVAAAILRYLQQSIVFNKVESPTKLVFKDLFLQIDVILWGLSIFFLKYFI
jgi:4-hydroxybenzoate polyprenyltransferase